MRVDRRVCCLLLAWLALPALAEESWRGDLAPLEAVHWNEARAAHLLERAGFGGTPVEVLALTKLGVDGAVRRLVIRIPSSGSPRSPR